MRKNLRLDRLNPEETYSITLLCNKCHDIFHLPDDILPGTNILKHRIPVTDPTPVCSRIYRFPEIHKQEVNTQISKLLKQGIIRLSVTPYNSPLWVVPKKRGASNTQKWRIVIDYRKLNNVIYSR